MSRARRRAKATPPSIVETETVITVGPAEPGFNGGRLVMVVEFPPDVEHDDIERIVDEARAYGCVRTAQFKRTGPYERDFA